MPKTRKSWQEKLAEKGWEDNLITMTAKLTEEAITDAKR
ncbi:unnamed protein product, partial [marine sediment metagenome]